MIRFGEFIKGVACGRLGGALLRHAAMAPLRENSAVERRDAYILSRTAIATHLSPCHARRGTPATRGPGQPARPTRPHPRGGPASFASLSYWWVPAAEQVPSY